MKLIFDLGANEGGNLNYYLSRAEKVVAVEANPALIPKLKEDFQSEIESNRLEIVNCCLNVNKNAEDVDFYVHKFKTGLGRFTKPPINSYDYKKIKVQSISYDKLIEQYGAPDFVKVDLEGFDKVLLSELISSNRLPAYLSFENCGRDIFERIIKTNHYNSFNILPFYNYEEVYGEHKTRTAGPMGSDLKTPWLSEDKIQELYNRIEHSWFDIHATVDEMIERDVIDYKLYEKKIDIVIFFKEISA